MEDQLLGIQRRTEQQLDDIRDTLAAAADKRAHMEKQLAQLLQRPAAQAASLSPSNAHWSSGKPWASSKWGCARRDTASDAARDRKRLKERLKKAVTQARLTPPPPIIPFQRRGD